VRRPWNLLVWSGFLVTLIGFLSYFLFFLRFPLTRDFPWANLLILAAGLLLVGAGVRRAFAQPEQYGGKVSALVLGVLSVVVVGLFGFFNFYLAKQLPESKGAPRVGEKAPDFTLPDKDGKPVTLSRLLTSPTEEGSGGMKTQGVLLIFYRGYW
jgi:hypothetical protein